MERKKSSIIKPIENLNNIEYHRAYRAFRLATMDWRWNKRTWQVGQGTCNHQKPFWNCPYEGSPFNVIVGITGKLDFPDCQLGYDVSSSNLCIQNYERVARAEKESHLTVRSHDGYPRRASPPCNGKAYKPWVLKSSTFGCPDINRATKWLVKPNDKREELIEPQTDTLTIAEQISASTAAVMNMKTIVIR